MLFLSSIRFLGNLDAAVRRDVEIRDLLQDDVDAEALRHDVTMLQKAVSDSRADGSKAKNSYSYLLHLCIWPFFFVYPYVPPDIKTACRLSHRHLQENRARRERERAR